MDNRKKIIITGAHGYIGKHLSAYLASRGYQVIRFVRKPDLAKGEVFYDINQEPDENEIAKADVLIHCAFIPKDQSQDALDQNIAGTRKLIETCKKHGVKMIFVSSLAAHPDAESDYGKHKYLLEQEMDFSKDVVVRPGLVIGNGGLFLRMLRFCKKFRIVPLIDGGRQPLQFISISDVAACIGKIVENNLSGSFTLVSNQQTSYRSFYAAISRIFGFRLVYVPIPVNLILFAITTASKMGIKLPVSKENLLGLKNMKYVDPATDMERLGIQPMSLEDSLRRVMQCSPFAGN